MQSQIFLINRPRNPRGSSQGILCKGTMKYDHSPEIYMDAAVVVLHEGR